MNSESESRILKEFKQIESKRIMDLISRFESNFISDLRSSDLTYIDYTMLALYLGRKVELVIQRWLDNRIDDVTYVNSLNILNSLKDELLRSALDKTKSKR